MSTTLGILLAITFAAPDGVNSSPRDDGEVTAPPVARHADAPADDEPASGRPGLPGARIIIRERIIIRVPSQPAPVDRALPHDDREPVGRGPRCVPVAAIRSVFPDGDRALMIDLGRRGHYRAALGRGCRSMDFHGGIYVAPQPDGLFCVERDLLRARSGASCAVSRFVDMP